MPKTSANDTARAVLVFSGFNQRAVIAFLRVLVRSSIEFGIVAIDEADPIFLTSYSSRVVATRRSRGLELNDMVRCVEDAIGGLGVSELLVAPSSEALNRFLLSNREPFESLGALIPLVDESLYAAVSDKRAFTDLCAARGILVPAEYAVAEEVNIPFVAKPKVYSVDGIAALSPILIESSQDLSVFRDDCRSEDYFYQEFVLGHSHYLLFYIGRNGRVCKYSQRNLMQQPGGKSVVAAIGSAIHDSDVSADYEKVLMSVGFYGLIMIEVKGRGDEQYLIEANPRFWGPSQLFVDAGVPIFEEFLADFGFPLIVQDHAGTCATPNRYYWHGGAEEVARNGSQLVCHEYSLRDYEHDLDNWLNADIYRREDTWNIYEKELELCQ